MACRLTYLFLTILSARLMLALKYIDHLGYCQGIFQDNDTCVYPKMCKCPMVNAGGYIRLTLWHYDNSKGRCRKIVGSNADGYCNMFDKKEDCRKFCKKPLKGRRPKVNT
ncbi:kunitz-type protease inhibitor 3-like [Dermacentor variabilis]|uniref:kunitz-type protease inhibitor 3-like n=1 Tax=Dermacentor variabilis TaxID=34621 RepID=UPI003F5B6B71